jgi:hypothetical protein
MDKDGLALPSHCLNVFEFAHAESVWNHGRVSCESHTDRSTKYYRHSEIQECGMAGLCSMQ